MSKVLDGEIFTANEPAYSVTYWRHRCECDQSATTLDTAIEFLYNGSDYGELSYMQSVVRNTAGDVVLNAWQVSYLVQNWEELPKPIDKTIMSGAFRWPERIEQQLQIAKDA